jgi:diacylglycerol kinase (ATP)
MLKYIDNILTASIWISLMRDPQSNDESPFKGKTGLSRIINAFGYTLDGLKAAFKHEDAFRQEVFLAIVLIPLALYLEHEALHRVLMIASLFLVLIAELFNSAIEAVVDRISMERHTLAKRAKDIGSAAVFLALANAIFTWGLILLT